MTTSEMMIFLKMLKSFTKDVLVMRVFTMQISYFQELVIQKSKEHMLTWKEDLSKVEHQLQTLHNLEKTGKSLELSVKNLDLHCLMITFNK